MLTFAANYAWGRAEVLGYHVVNVAIHLAAGTLLWALSRRLLRSPGTPSDLSRAAESLAWFIAALWLVHPLQTNAVTYTVQRFESLASLGILASLYAVVRCAGIPRDDAQPLAKETASDADHDPAFGAHTAGAATAHGIGQNFGVIGWGVLALLSGWMATQTKEIAVGLPILSVTLDRAFLADSWRTLVRRRGWVHAGLAFVAGVLLYQSQSAFVASPANSTASAGFSVQGLTSWMYIRSQPAVIMHYLRLVIWPDHLCLDYGWPVSDSVARIYGCGSVILALLAATVHALFRRPRIGFLGLAFFTVLGPTSSFIPIADLAFEHRMYLPLAPLVGLAAITFFRLSSGIAHAPWPSTLLPRRLPRLALMAGVAIAIVAAFAGRTWQRNSDFAAPEKLWRQCIARNPLYLRPHLNLGKLLNTTGRSQAAIELYKEASRFAPDSAELHSQWGAALRNLGKLDQATERFEAAVRLSPRFSPGWHNLGVISLDKKDFPRAVESFRREVSLNADAVEGWSGLGWSLELCGEHREAVDCYRQALAIDPSLIVTRTRLAELLATTEHADLRDPREALTLADSVNRRTGGNNPYVLAALAAAHNANRNSRLAADTAERALRRTRDAALRERLEQRLIGYRQAARDRKDQKSGA
jgi:tetratricopeptide (TPR) repeat protein